MKGTDIAILAGVGIVGYGLLNSGFFKGLGQVGSGVGDAVGGLGEGIGYAGSAAGYNLAEIFGAVGQLGQSSQVLIKEGGLQSREIIREGGELITDIIFEVGEDLPAIVGNVGDVPRDISGAASDVSGSLRSVNKGFWNAFNQTWNLDEPTNIFTNTAAGVGNVFSWVKKQVSPKKSLRVPSITGAVIASPTGSSPSSSGSTGGSSSGGSIRSTTRNTFLESIGYQGQSTPTGITYTKPAPTFLGKPIASVRTPVASKPWYKFW